MKARSILLSSLGTLSFLSTGALAAPLEITGNVAVVSNYIFRGISFSADEPATQGGFDIGHESGTYLGIWGSSDAGNGEFDVYGGYNFSVNDDLSVDVGVLRYFYPEVGGHTTEWHIAASFKMLTLAYHNDTTLESNYYELNAEHDFGNNFAISAHYGIASPDEGEDFNDYNIAGTYTFNDTYSAYAMYSDHESDIEFAESTFHIGISGNF